MANKLIIILHRPWSEHPENLVQPLFQAAAAAAMQFETEVILSGLNIDLARRDVAAGIAIHGNGLRTLYDYLQEAVHAGATIKVCSPPADWQTEDMIPEIEELVGAAYIISEAMDPDSVTLTY
ncbi:MAG: hypothetical protein KDI15_07465 [Thiothrix sp.]|nr:hypothetical protein [Thiothrix sp.]HPE61062.1 hypothetical protein [Thiolinea sp.]